MLTFIVNIFGDTMLPSQTPSSCEHSVIYSDFTFSPFLKNYLWSFVDQKIFQLFACMLFFKDAIKIQNGRQKSTPKFFVGAKT